MSMNTLILVLMLPLLAYGQDYKLNAEGQAIPSYVGKVRAFRGQIDMLSKGKSTKVKVGAQLYRYDTLSTRDKSLVKLAMVDETVVTLGPNSEIRFDEYEFVGRSDRKIHSFVRGQLSSFVKNKAKPGDIVFKTKSATFGIRGTHLLINSRLVNKVEVSEFALLSGSGEIDDGKGYKLLLAPGDRLVVADNTVKTEERAFDKLLLTVAETEYLEVKDKNDEEFIWPLLPYFEPSSLSKASPLYLLFNQQQSEATPTTVQPNQAKDPEGTGTFENIRKLNEKLRQ